MDTPVAQILYKLETARLILVDQLVILDQCSPDEHPQEAFKVLLAYLRLNRQNKAGNAALRLVRKSQTEPRG